MRHNVIISVSEAGTLAARTLTYKILVDAETVSERTLTPVESQEVREMAGQYISLFHESCKAKAQEYLPILGEGLFHIFLEKGWQDLGPKLSSGANITIASSIPQLLQLPWEQLRLPDEVVLGFDERFCILRHPLGAERLPAAKEELPPGPLRVLFMACDPLDYELEELRMLQTAEGLDMVQEIGDAGTWEELKSQGLAFRPHLVHLAGQAKMKGGRALFSLLGSGGSPDLRDGEELALALAGSGVQCILLGGCQREAPSSLDLLCQGMAERLPLAIAWNASADSSRLFYSLLSQGKSLTETLGLVRMETQRVCQEQGEICALPVLYAKSDQLRIFEHQRRSEVALATDRELQPLPGMTEGYAKRFVDRRMDLERLGSALREGTTRTLVITGPDGTGKSSLGAKLAIKLASLGYSLLTIYSSPQNPITAARLMEAVIAFFAAAGQAEAAQRLRNPALPLAERQKIMLDELKRGRILLFLDGLELDSRTGRIKDPELAGAYLQMLRGMESSRVIFAIRALPADAVTLPARAREWPLAGLSQAAFIKFLLDDEAVARRYRRGEIPYKKLQEAHSSVAGSPACLAQIAQVLGREGEIDICEEVLAKLADSLDPQSLLALRKTAAFGIAVSPAGLGAATGLPEDQALAFARDWQQASLAYQVGRLWAVPSSVRARLFMALSPEERLAAQRAAASFLWDLAESGRSRDLGLSRLDALLEARGHFLAAGYLESARAVTDRISGFLERRGYYLELIRLNQELLERELHAEPMNWIARAYLDQGDLERAQEWYGQALAAGPNAAAYHGLGTSYLRQGKLDLARESFQQALEICRSAGDRAGEAAALHGLASLDMEKKDDEAALEKLQKVAAIQEQLGDLEGMASTLQELAGLDLRRGDSKAARPRLVKSLEILQRLGDRKGEATARYKLASLDLERGEFDAARAEFSKALALRRDLGDLRGEASILHSLGSIEAQSGDWEKARERFLDALRIYQQLGDRSGEAGAFFQLGALAVQKEKIQEGLRLMALSAVILRSIKSEEVRNVEPLVERLASQLHYSQEQFMAMVQEVFWSYRKDQGWGLVGRAFAEK